MASSIAETPQPSNFEDGLSITKATVQGARSKHVDLGFSKALTLCQLGAAKIAGNTQKLNAE
jgi:hypothetical protein